MRANKAATITTARMDMILKLDALHFDRDMYDKFFDSALETDSKDTAYISKLTETKEKIDDLIDVINSNFAQRNEIKQLINNQQLRSGLMGVTKQNILKNVSTAEIFKYPEYLRDVIIRPYDDTPYKKKVEN